MIEYVDNLTSKLCQDNPNKIYVCGDNLAGYGTAGQACIRKEPNSFGIPTKRYPSMSAGSFFTDQKCEEEHVLNSLRDLYVLSKRHTIVFPTKGIGTGLAKMKETSPAVYTKMCEILLKHFGVKNG